MPLGDEHDSSTALAGASKVNWKDLFLSMEGRTTRMPYWIACFIIIVAEAFIYVPVSMVFGVSFSELWSINPEPLSPNVVFVDLIVLLVVLYPTLAITIKRLHDRNRTGWWAGLIVASLFLFYLFELMGISSFPEDESVPLLPQQIAYLCFLGGFLLLALWLLTETLFLSGTPGTNRYGPDPLQRRSDAEMT